MTMQTTTQMTGLAWRRRFVLAVLALALAVGALGGTGGIGSGWATAEVSAVGTGGDATAGP
jgi:hypothetical protein